VCDRNRVDIFLPFEHNARQTDKQTDHGTVTSIAICGIACQRDVASLKIVQYQMARIRKRRVNRRKRLALLGLPLARSLSVHVQSDAEVFSSSKPSDAPDENTVNFLTAEPVSRSVLL